jgi:hypothetical protein
MFYGCTTKFKNNVFNHSLMQNKRFFVSGTLIAVIISMVFMLNSVVDIAVAQETTNTTNTTTNTTTMEEHSSIAEESSKQQQGTIVRDSSTILLSNETIPAGGFIQLYDSAPYAIVNGHITAKIPCDDNSNSTLTVLTGSVPELQPAELKLVQNLSTPGTLCMYHIDLSSEGESGFIITDIVIKNPGVDDIKLPSTSTVVIGVNKILRLYEEYESSSDISPNAITTLGQ